MEKQHWQDAVTFALGLWVIVSPWTIEHIMAGPANPGGLTEAVMWNHYGVGIGVVIFAVVALIAFNAWQEWLNLVLGAWLLASPWLLGFNQSVALMWNAVIVGGLVVIFAGWALSAKQGPEQLAE